MSSSNSGSSSYSCCSLATAAVHMLWHGAGTAPPSALTWATSQFVAARPVASRTVTAVTSFARETSEPLTKLVKKLDEATGKIELKKVQTESALPYGIQINSKGVPFFCELGTNKMGKIDPVTMELTEYKLPEGARPRRLMIAADDAVYFTDFKDGRLGRLDPSNGAVKMWASPGGKDSGPYGIAITPDGMVWYSESGVKPLSSAAR